METKFGQDLGQVRVHTNVFSAESARAIQAKAYTLGPNIVFSAGRYMPETATGKRLLVHELSHVVQQTRRNGRSTYGAALEHEAQGAANQLSYGQYIAVQNRAPVGIQRSPEDESYLKRGLSWLKQSGVTEATSELVEKGKQAAYEAKDQAFQKIEEVKQDIAKTRDQLVTAAQQAYDNAAASVKKVKTNVARTVVQLSEKTRALKKAAKQKIQEAKEQVAAVTSHVIQGAKREASDTVLRYTGRAKGVVMEVATLADTLMWLDYEVDNLKRKALTKVLDYSQEQGWLSEHSKQDALSLYDTLLSNKLQYKRAEEAGLISMQEGAPSVAEIIGPALDKQAQKLESYLDPTPSSEALIFTSYEIGELEGAIGSQVALAFVGVEEVQLVLKILGAVGGVKGIVQSIEKNPGKWETDPAFWTSIFNAVLSVLGLSKTLAARKIIQMILSSSAFVNLIPAVSNLYRVYTDPELEKDPAKQRTARLQAVKGLLLAGKDVVMTIIHAGKGKGPKPAETEPSAGTPKEGGAPTPVIPEEVTQTQPSSTKPELTEPTVSPTSGQTSPTPSAGDLTNTPPLIAVEGQPSTPLFEPPPALKTVPKSDSAPTAGAGETGKASKVTPLLRREQPKVSEASKQLEKKLENVQVGQEDNVISLKQKAQTPPGPETEPAVQQLPVEEPVELPVAVGQTHGPETVGVSPDVPQAMAQGGGGKKPSLTVVGGGKTTSTAKSTEASGSAKSASKTTSLPTEEPIDQSQQQPPVQGGALAEEVPPPAAAPHQTVRLPKLANPTADFDGKLVTLAREERIHNTDLSPDTFRQNIAVFKVEVNGKIEYLSAANIPGGKHSETLVVHQLETLSNSKSLKGVRILQVYSEREPCAGCGNDLSGLKRILKQDFPVFWTVSQKTPLVRRATELMRQYGIGQ